MYYSIALFLHIVGALGLFAALALEGTSLFYLRRSVTAEQARSWMNVLGLVRRLGPTSLVFILLPGFYMMATVWGGVPWIAVTLATILLFPLLGAFSGIRLAAIGRSVETEAGLLSPVVRRQLRNPLFWISVQMRTMNAEKGFPGTRARDVRNDGQIHRCQHGLTGAVVLRGRADQDLLATLGNDAKPEVEDAVQWIGRRPAAMEGQGRNRGVVVAVGLGKVLYDPR